MPKIEFGDLGRMEAAVQTVIESANDPFVSVIMPVRNEAHHIDAAARSVLAGDYPPERLELIIVDGMSTDGSLLAATALTKEFQGRVRVISNPKCTTPHARNLGLENAQGELIAFADAHAEYPANYVSGLYHILSERPEMSAAGVQILTLPGNENKIAACIALAMSMPFGVGDSHSRIGVDEPREVDTIFGGLYRREVFEAHGNFNTTLIRGQDDEFNHRLSKHGLRLMVTPVVSVKYFARTTIKKLSAMTFQYGMFKPLAGKLVGRPTTIRQFAPPLFVVALFALALGCVFPQTRLSCFVILAGLLGLHLLVGGTMSFIKARHAGRIWLAPGAYICALVMHLSYGTGYLVGLARILLRIGHGVDHPITR